MNCETITEDLQAFLDNELKDARRSEHKVMVDSDSETQTEFASQVASDSPSPAAAFEQQEAQNQVQGALTRLDAEQRDPILLREYEGLSYEEIAEITGCNLGTVKSRLNRARNSFAQLIEPLVQ